MSRIFTLVSLFLTASLLFISINTSSADTLLGSVTLMRTDGVADVYPLVSGNKIAYGQKALIRVAGGSFVVEEGSDLVVTSQEEHLAFDIENGITYFRIQPHKAVISFNTENGSFKTPGIVKASTSIVEGKIMVNEDETILELSEGSLQALTTDGIETVNAGDRITMVAQAVIDESPAVENGSTDPPTTVAKTYQCSDGIDNDNDGFTDYPEDPGCESADDDQEGGLNPYVAPVIIGVTTAAAITTVVIVTSNNNKDRSASIIIQ